MARSHSSVPVRLSEIKIDLISAVGDGWTVEISPSGTRVPARLPAAARCGRAAVGRSGGHRSLRKRRARAARGGEDRDAVRATK